MKLKNFPALLVYGLLFFNMPLFSESHPVSMKEYCTAGFMNAYRDNDTIPGAKNKSDQDQLIAKAIEDYLKEDINVLENKTNRAASNPEPQKRIVTSLVHGNTSASGSMLPVFEKRKEDQKGSRFLLKSWVNGLVVDFLDTILNNPGYYFNYDKVSGNLLLTQDLQNYIEVERAEVKIFVLKQENKGYIFEHVFSINKNDAFYQRIALGAKYGLYKAIKTKFVRANYQSTGMIESGNNYDEYVDEYTYYLVDLTNNLARQFELKKKSIKEAFHSANALYDQYLEAHKHDDLDEVFLRGLTNYINQ